MSSHYRANPHNWAWPAGPWEATPEGPGWTGIFHGHTSVEVGPFLSWCTEYNCASVPIVLPALQNDSHVWNQAQGKSKKNPLLQQKHSLIREPVVLERVIVCALGALRPLTCQGRHRGFWEGPFSKGDLASSYHLPSP
jgi:hypothetical protein